MRVFFPSNPTTVIIGSPWRLPTSKSLKSWAGVTFTAPVPNFGSTRIASATIGKVRPRIGWRTSFPTRCR